MSILNPHESCYTERGRKREVDREADSLDSKQLQNLSILISLLDTICSTATTCSTIIQSGLSSHSWLPRDRERPRLRPSWPPAPAPTSASVPCAGHVWAHVLVSLSGHVASAVGLIRIYFPTLSPHMCVRGLNNVFFHISAMFFLASHQVSSMRPWLTELQRPTNATT